MKYGKTINPKDVSAMMRSGELGFGMKLEFGDTPEFDTIGARILIFCGFMTNTGKFLCRFKNESTPRLYKYARFPVPDLRDGDPVVTSCGNIHFYKFCVDSPGIWCYSHGDSNWTYSAGDFVAYVNWRLPTIKELREAGMENWFDGRDIVLEDE